MRAWCALGETMIVGMALYSFGEFGNWFKVASTIFVAQEYVQMPSPTITRTEY